MKDAGEAARGRRCDGRRRRARARGDDDRAGRGRADSRSWRRRCRPDSARRRHRDRRDDRARGHRRRRAVRRRPGVPPRRDRRLPRARRAGDARAASRRRRSSTAHERGADIVKVFPATALGPQFIKDVRAPLPQVKLMPTGGVTLDNAGDWIRAGAVAVGVGLGAARRQGDRERAVRRDHGQRAAHRRERRVPRGRSSSMRTRSSRFGEIMLRLSPPGFERFFQSPVLSATFGGGEANVAVSLAHFGLESHYVTRLPSHAIGDAAVRALRAEGVRHRARRPRRRPRRHLFRGDRREPARVDGHLRPRAFVDQRDPRRRGGLGRVMDGAAWFHVTGITPALGEHGRRRRPNAAVAAASGPARGSASISTTARSSGPRRRRRRRCGR